MKTMKGVVIRDKGVVEISDDCVLPDKINSQGALIKPLIWSPCTSDTHLCETGCASLPYLLNKAIGHEMCGIVEEVGEDVKDFQVGDRVIVCAVMPIWRSLEAQDGHAKNRQDNMYAGIDYPDRGGSFVEHYYIRDADMNLAHIPDNVTLDQAIMIPDMMCTAFEGVSQLDIHFGDSIAILGIGPVGLMALRASVLRGAANVYAIGSRQICFDVAKEYGATHCIDYHDDHYPEQIIQMNGGLLDGVIVCGGDETSINQALKMVKKGGNVVNLSAFFGGKDILISPETWGFGYGDKTIKGVGCSGGRLMMSRMAHLIACGRVQPEKMITHRFYGMDKIPEAMQLFMHHDRSLIKPVIYNQNEGL